MTARRVALATLVAVLLVALLPHDAWAWSPGTHIFLGQAVLENLNILPAAAAELLRGWPLDFLYGSIAADTSFAKKYVPVGRHSHAWHVGQEIHDLAGSPGQHAFGLGYLAHLAADVVAHNHFVPRQLTVTSSTMALGHSYWEARFDMHVGEEYGRRAWEVLQHDHSANDAHLDRIISPTIFSVRTNRRLFRGMVYLTETQGWQRAFQVLSEHSRWDLPNTEVEEYLLLTFDLLMEFLSYPDATVLQWDPSGEQPLRTAKGMRRQALVAGAWREPGRLRDVAEAHFGLPQRQFQFLPRAEVTRPWLTGESLNPASA